MKKILAAVICAAVLLCGASVFAQTGTAAEKTENIAVTSREGNQIWQTVPGMERFEWMLRKNIESYLGEGLPKGAWLDQAEERETETETELPKEVSNIIFVGDSRVVGMSWAGGYLYVGKESIGYDWFVSEGTYQMQNLMAQYPDAEVVLCFGINDVGNIGAYISYYQTLMQTWPDTNFWVMSVNPVNDGIASSCGYYINSSMVYQFNDAMRQAFPEEYLDVASYLEQNGFGTSDGVHYDTGTYLTVQEYAKQLIQEKLQK